MCFLWPTCHFPEQKVDDLCEPTTRPVFASKRQKGNKNANACLPADFFPTARPKRASRQSLKLAQTAKRPGRSGCRALSEGKEAWLALVSLRPRQKRSKEQMSASENRAMSAWSLYDRLTLWQSTYDFGGPQLFGSTPVSIRSKTKNPKNPSKLEKNSQVASRPSEGATGRPLEMQLEPSMAL